MKLLQQYEPICFVSKSNYPKYWQERLNMNKHQSKEMDKGTTAKVEYLQK